MKTQIVKKNNHYPNCHIFYNKPLFYYNNKNFIKIINIPKSSYFSFNGENIYDYSKLWGVSFGHHQKNESYRFAFRMIDENNFEIALYYYIQNKRIIEPIADLKYYRFYKYIIDFEKNKNKLTFYIADILNFKIRQPIYKNIENFKNWGYTLGLYIGGNLPSPIDFKVNYL